MHGAERMLTGTAVFASSDRKIRNSPNLILRIWCQPTVMKKILVLAIVLVAINQWDTNYNNGTLTRAGFSLARALGQSFGI